MKSDFDRYETKVLLFMILESIDEVKSRIKKLDVNNATKDWVIHKTMALQEAVSAREKIAEKLKIALQSC